MNHELAKTLTTALVQFIDRERPEGTMCCSNIECGALEEAFKSDNLDDVEAFIQKKLSGLTEFEQSVKDIIQDILTHTAPDGSMTFAVSVSNEEARKLAKSLLIVARKELLSYADESNPAIEAMADLERTFECNPDKLPGWLKDELAKRNLEGYIKGRNDALREMSDFMESHFDTKKQYNESVPYHFPIMPTTPVFGCDGTHCTNPQMDCLNCPRRTTGGSFSTSSASGTSAATLHGNTSVTDGKPHNPSFTD